MSRVSEAVEKALLLGFSFKTKPSIDGSPYYRVSKMIDEETAERIRRGERVEGEEARRLVYYLVYYFENMAAGVYGMLGFISDELENDLERMRRLLGTENYIEALEISRKWGLRPI